MNYKKSVFGHQVYRHDTWFYIVNKSAGIGIAAIIIALIIGIAYSSSSTEPSEENLPTIEELDLGESVSLEGEIVAEELEEIEEPEQTSTDFSVELTEKLGIKSP